MLRLIEPCEAYLASYTEAFDEYEGYPRAAGNPLSNPHIRASWDRSISATA